MEDRKRSKERMEDRKDIQRIDWKIERDLKKERKIEKI